MCGILGVVATSPVNQLLYDGLMVLQHRGQDAAGIATVEDDAFHMHKGSGLGFEDLVNRGDKALYRVKESGRNAVYCADLSQGAWAAGQMHRSDPQDCAGGSLFS